MDSASERALHDAISEAVQENAVVYRGITTDGYLFFERKDRSQPLSQPAAMSLARAIAGNIRNIGTVRKISVEQFLASQKGLRIA